MRPATLLLALPLAGCAYPADVKHLGPTDFAVAAATNPRPVVDTPQTPVVIESADSDTTLLLESIDTLVGPPEPSLDAAPTTTTLLIDAKVGDINGHPIIASEFFAKISNRLSQEARRRDRQEWRLFAANVIHTELELILENDLLEQEARSSLPPDVKAGLFRFLESIRKTMISQSGGVQSQADRYARQTKGVGLDEQVEQTLDEELIRLAYHDNVSRRVWISWHDIELTYERYYDFFNPKPRVVYRQIRVLRTYPEDVEKITAALDNGDPFEDVASMKENVSENQGLVEKEFENRDDDIADLEPFNVESLNDAFHTLEPGQIVGPLQTAASVYWIKLEKIERPKGLTLYEAQARILEQLREHRENLEKARYLSALKHDASYTDLEEMTERLLIIAESRFYPD